MGKISNYASALKAKLTDLFVIASDNNGVLETKKVTTEQIGDAVASDQTHSLLDTSDKTLIGGINEVNSNVGTLSSLTTTDKSSLVGAVNEVNNLPRPTTSISSARSDITQWNTSAVPNTRAGTINLFMVFNNSGTAQPMITHAITCSRNILSISMIGFNITTGTNSASASYDNGNIKWNTGLLQGVYICMGTIVFE